MNEKINEMLGRMDKEIEQKLSIKVQEHDAEIKVKAQEAYDNCVKEEIAALRAEIEKEYDVARKYLEDCKEPEIEEKHEEVMLEREAPVEEPAEDGNNI